MFILPDKLRSHYGDAAYFSTNFYHKAYIRCKKCIRVLSTFHILRFNRRFRLSARSDIQMRWGERQLAFSCWSRCLLCRGGVNQTNESERRRLCARGANTWCSPCMQMRCAAACGIISIKISHLAFTKTWMGCCVALSLSLCNSRFTGWDFKKSPAYKNCDSVNNIRSLIELL